jgi:hypothetical protein
VFSKVASAKSFRDTSYQARRALKDKNQRGHTQKRINNHRHSFEGAISDHQEQGLGGFDIIGIFEVNLFTM